MSRDKTAENGIVEAELLALHRKYFDVILLPSEDSEEILRNISADDISFFGTGKDEHGFSLEQWININLRAIEQIPEGASYTEKTIRCRVNESLGVVEAELILTMPGEGQPVELLTRISTVYQKKLNKWKAVHVHVSFPSSEQPEGEAWPIEALEAKNRELTKTVAERTADLNKTLADLRATQAQLIQSEKMASLGELTAGIAHEIQNPLNFVNNFSEINKELIEELKMQNAKIRNEEMDDLLNDLATNEEKINYHGMRAGAIVKGMLQHSRSSSGQKEPTDLNALCDEYLRLAYHGFRAKDKNFNAVFKTDFDPAIGQLSIVPQDIGRVLLNVISNAFYAVNERAKQNIPGYEPTVSVKTSKIHPSELVPNSLREGGGAEISVSDNGNGIPDSVISKIFQPFFTTKPTGQGTGLGLSLAFDIITKGHGGLIKVEPVPEGGAAFIIKLPVT